jgi:hypothetical protein
MPCDSCKNQRFGRKYRLHQQGEKNRWARNNASSNKQSKQAAKKYYERSSEASVRTRATWRYIPEIGILRSHRSGNFKSHKSKIVGRVVFYAVRVLSRQMGELISREQSYLF